MSNGIWRSRAQGKLNWFRLVSLVSLVSFAFIKGCAYRLLYCLNLSFLVNYLRVFHKTRRGRKMGNLTWVSSFEVSMETTNLLCLCHLSGTCPRHPASPSSFIFERKYIMSPVVVLLSRWWNAWCGFCLTIFLLDDCLDPQPTIWRSPKEFRPLNGPFFGKSQPLEILKRVHFRWWLLLFCVLIAVEWVRHDAAKNFFFCPIIN